MGSRSSDTDSPESRRGITNTLLQKFGGSDSRVFLVGATNTPWQMDPAFVRRFSQKFYIQLPDYEARLANITKTLQVMMIC